MRLIDIMVWVLTNDHDLDVRQRRVSTPAVHVLEGWEDLLACLALALQELLEVEEGLVSQVVGEIRQPGVVQRLDLELQQLLLLVGEGVDPLLLVEFGCFAGRWRCIRFRRVRVLSTRNGFGRSEERGDGGVLGLLGWVFVEVFCLAFDSGGGHSGDSGDETALQWCEGSIELRD